MDVEEEVMEEEVGRRGRTEGTTRGTRMGIKRRDTLQMNY